MKHRISKYSDGYKVIEFCRVCGEEDVLDTQDCPGQPVPNLIVDNKEVDKKSEQN